MSAAIQAVIPTLVRLSFWATGLCGLWLCGSWFAHRFQPAVTRVRFRDFVHLGRLRVAAGVVICSAALWAAYFWPGAGLPRGAALQQASLEVSTGGWDAYAQVEGVSAARELEIPLTGEETRRLEELLAGHTRWRSLYGRQRYELGAITVRGTLALEDGETLPFVLVSTQDQAYWRAGDGFWWNLSGRDRLTGELVDFANQALEGR